MSLSDHNLFNPSQSPLQWEPYWDEKTSYADYTVVGLVILFGIICWAVICYNHFAGCRRCIRGCCCACCRRQQAPPPPSPSSSSSDNAIPIPPIHTNVTDEVSVPFIFDNGGLYNDNDNDDTKYEEDQKETDDVKYDATVLLASHGEFCTALYVKWSKKMALKSDYIPVVFLPTQPAWYNKYDHIPEIAKIINPEVIEPEEVEHELAVLYQVLWTKQCYNRPNMWRIQGAVAGLFMMQDIHKFLARDSTKHVLYQVFVNDEDRTTEYGKRYSYDESVNGIAQIVCQMTSCARNKDLIPEHILLFTFIQQWYNSAADSDE